MSVDVYSMLSEPIRRYIRDKHWDSFRPIQTVAIMRIMTTDKDYILASRTASGKTEAAFLPAISKVDFEEHGVQILYISPLIALINDQTQRVEDLCKYLDITVTKWHGEASRSAKNKLIKQPNGIVLITPESLEAMFVNRPYNARSLFSNLKYVIIDEIHHFIGTDRGIQLKSLLSRLQSLHTRKFNIIGLSATIGDFDEAKNFNGQPDNAIVLRDTTTKLMKTQFKYIKETNGVELPLELLKQLYVDTKDKKTLIFPNSRGRVEEIAVKLNKIAKRVGGNGNYFSHHSAIDKEKREYIESFAKKSSKSFSIACTSTLELGIDIGSVDTVIQIDSTFNISSLIQRVGRSGRKDDAYSNLLLYATNKWDLLQSLACWSLHQKGVVEPPDIVEYPYDLLAHQLLSITKEYCGVGLEHLVRMISVNSAFKTITLDDIKLIIKHLLDTNILEYVQNEVILGIEGEKLVNTKDFYSSFIVDRNLKVLHKGDPIGELQFGNQLQIGNNIFLAAKIWTIKDIDFDMNRIYVLPAIDGKKPSFFGVGGCIPDIVAQEMLDIIYSDKQYEILDGESILELNGLRKEFSNLSDAVELKGRPQFKKDAYNIIYPFVGTKKWNAIRVVVSQLKSMGFGVDLDVDTQTVKIAKGLPLSTLVQVSQDVIMDIDNLLSQTIETPAGQQQLISCSKWGFLLPFAFQVKIIKQKLFDFDIFSVTPRPTTPCRS